MMDISGEGLGKQGAATLLRGKNRLAARVMVNVADYGFPYTIWWVIFNNPSHCMSNPCTAGDLMTPAVNASVFNASGAIAAANPAAAYGGVINASFETDGGPVPEGVARNTTLPGNGLDEGNGLKAEVHLVVVRHNNIPLDSWVEDLTTPANGANHRGATFLPVR